MGLTQTADYYDQMAARYDVWHGKAANPEHTRAMELGWPLLGEVKSVLDVGAGTGRSLEWINALDRGIELRGVEPSRGLIEIASKKLPTANIHQGVGENLPYPDGSIDAVIATGIMHHVDDPDRVITEMFRVAKIGVLISDHNNYAFGGKLARKARMALKLGGLFEVATFIKQGFNKRGYSEDDGWWYPYSISDSFPLIASLSENTFIDPYALGDAARESIVLTKPLRDCWS